MRTWRLPGVALALLAVLMLASPSSSVAAVPQPQVQARAWALLDARTGDILESHAAARRLPIASTTKLMTAYIVLKELSPAKVVRAKPYTPIYGESLLGLRTGQRVSIRDLLYGLILRSGNDAAYNLALAAAGSEPRFVREMNMRAAALGLSNTHYANPVGLDQKGNYSSAADLGTLTRHLLRIPLFAKIVDSRSAELRSMRPRRHIATVNELLRLAPWTNGVKTGHTFGAAYVEVGAGRRKGVELISVMIGAPTDEERFEGSVRLLESGFAMYRRRQPIRAGQVLTSAPIRYSGGELPLVAARTVSVGVRRGQRLRVSLVGPGEVEGPLPRGAVLGRASVFLGGLQAASVALRASWAVPKASLFDRVRGFLGADWIALGGVAFVIVIGAALLRRTVRRRRDDGDPPNPGLKERKVVTGERQDGELVE